MRRSYQYLTHTRPNVVLQITKQYIEIFRENTGITIPSFSLSNTPKLMLIVFWSFGYFHVSSMVGGELKMLNVILLLEI
jgi:hypothetical protein